MKYDIEVGFGDYVLINSAVISLNGIMRKCNLNVSELTKWFDRSEKLYFKYAQEAEKIGVKIEDVNANHPFDIFFHTFACKDETIAKYYSNHFNKHGNNYIHELEHLETFLSDKKSFDEWVTKMEPVIKASEYLTEYAASHTAIDETIANAAKSSEQISVKYKEVYNRLERRILEGDIREKSEKILEMIPYLKTDMPNIDIVNKT